MIVAQKKDPYAGFPESHLLSGQQLLDQDLPALLVRALVALNSAGVPYCYWKQSSKLGGVLAGQSDLDLLAPRRARESFLSIMQAQGFKVWPDASALNQREFISLLGYDEDSGIIFHVHVHFRLLLGSPLSKVFHLPIEEAVVSRSLMHPEYPIRVLDPLDELLMLRLRRALEGSWLDIVSWRARLKAGGTQLRPEVSTGAADPSALRERAATFLSEPAAALLSTTDASEAGSSGGLRRALRRDLKPWRYQGALRANMDLLSRSIYLVASRLNHRFFCAPVFARRVAPAGGLLIAFVGVDGSGKSTQLAQTGRWLSSEIDVMTTYFGTGDGPASLLFRPMKAVGEAIGSRLRVKPKGSSHGRVSDRPPGPAYSIMFAVWALAVAWDKRTKLAAAQRAVARGFIVIADRYPQNEIPSYNDGPLLHRLPVLPDWLTKFESSIYERARRTPPDLVIKLHASLATVRRREPEMRQDLIQKRIDWLKELSCGGATSISIDASLPLVEVTRIVRRAIWDML